MDKNDVKMAIDDLSNRLGIDINSIINDTNLDQYQKMGQVHKLVLTASLKLWQQKDTKGAFNLPPDFNVEEFIDSQMVTVDGSQEKTEKYLQYIPNILFKQEKADKIKKMRGDEISYEVDALFNLSNTALQEKYTDPEELASLLIEFGIYAISAVGAMVAIAGITVATEGAAIALAVAMGISSAITSVLTFFSFIVSLFALGVIFDRSFFGLVLNDTEHDLLIPGWKESHNRSKNESGIYRKHGWLSGIVVDDYKGKKTAVILAKEKPTDLVSFCFGGLYLFEKETSAYGSEGTIRFEIDKLKFDLFSACPLSSDNMIYISDKYTDQTMGKSNDSMEKDWKKDGKKTEKEIKTKGITIACSLNQLRNSPAYGIVYLED